METQGFALALCDPRLEKTFDKRLKSTRIKTSRNFFAITQGNLQLHHSQSFRLSLAHKPASKTHPFPIHKYISLTNCRLQRSENGDESTNIMAFLQDLHCQSRDKTSFCHGFHNATPTLHTGAVTQTAMSAGFSWRWGGRLTACKVSA